MEADSQNIDQWISSIPGLLCRVEIRDHISKIESDYRVLRAALTKIALNNVDFTSSPEYVSEQALATTHDIPEAT